MTALLALALLADQESASKTLDYRIEASPLRRVVSELGRQAELKLLVSDELANEPVILLLKQVRAKEAMDRLASTIGASWSKRQDGSLLLYRPDSLTKKYRVEALAQRAASYRETLKPRVDWLAAQKPFDDDEAARLVKEQARLLLQSRAGDRRLGRAERQVWEETPGARLAVRIAASIDADELAAIPADTRVVFSTHPIGPQRALEDLEPDDLERFRRQHGAYLKAVRASERESPGLFPPDLLDERIGQGALKAKASFVRSSAYETAYLEVHVVDAKA